MHVSIVLPTHNRAGILRRTLDLYAQQIGPKDGFEVIVIDDASGDTTPDVVEQALRIAPYPLIARRLDANSGPSRARNVALGLARGDIILFSGDDILPAADFVARHRDWHVRLHPEETSAMVGHIVWARDMDATALLRWLETMGTQYHYGDMRDGAEVTPDRFYTSNVSVKRAFLDRTGHRFDERMRYCEDSEFAARLSGCGMTLFYDAAARAEHLHPTDLASSLRRMRALGQALAAMESFSPQTFARVTAGVLDRSSGWRGRFVRAALSSPLRRLVYEPLAGLCERRVRADRIFALAHAANMLEGVRRGREGVAP